MEDLYRAGGVQAIYNELSRRDLVDKEVLTVTGAKLGENIAATPVLDYEVIRPSTTLTITAGDWPYCSATWLPKGGGQKGRRRSGDDAASGTSPSIQQ